MGNAIILLFTFTIGFSALLMFSIQPLVARQFLPVLGGTPAVWTTCLLFFQTTLLAGYLYAHGLSRLKVGRQVTVHLSLLALAAALAVSGPDRPGDTPSSGFPVWWLLRELVIIVALPAIALSASSPLLQRWYSLLGHQRSSDPYFLFAGSNAGSLIGLLGYPILVEPHLGLARQRDIWEMGVAGLAALVAACAWHVRRSTRSDAFVPGGLARLDNATRARWVLLAFIPSSLTLGVTTYITTDLVSIPLLWVVPLSLYLLTFVVTFGPWKPVSHRTVVDSFPFVLLPVAILLASDLRGTFVGMTAPHLLLLVAVGLLCHGELELGRPQPERLPEFYLWIAIGGALGGLFNAVVAPMLFDSVVEYPLVVSLSAFVLALRQVAQGRRLGIGFSDLIVAAAVGVAVVVGFPLVRRVYESPLTMPLAMAIPALALFGIAASRPLRFGLGVSALVVAATWVQTAARGTLLHQSRSFFGVHRVVVDEALGLVNLLHGTTIHGRRSLDEQSGPVSYYHANSPIAEVFRHRRDDLRDGQIGVLGLGSGGLVTHGSEGQRWTFFEIDEAVVRIATNPRLFPFLPRAKPAVEIVVGDGRTLLANAPVRYDLLVVDAFSSDAIPLHLLSREAMDLYLSRLNPRGLVALHISNRYMDLRPVVAGLAEACGLEAYVKAYRATPDDLKRGHDGSVWAIVGREEAGLRSFELEGWQRLNGGAATMGVWTDDYANVFAVLRWR